VRLDSAVDLVFQALLALGPLHRGVESDATRQAVAAAGALDAALGELRQCAVGLATARDPQVAPVRDRQHTGDLRPALSARRG
jgi:hypothetical protein